MNFKSSKTIWTGHHYAGLVQALLLSLLYPLKVLIYKSVTHCTNDVTHLINVLTIFSFPPPSPFHFCIFVVYCFGPLLSLEVGRGSSLKYQGLKAQRDRRERTFQLTLFSQKINFARPLLGRPQAGPTAAMHVWPLAGWACGARAACLWSAYIALRTCLCALLVLLLYTKQSLHASNNCIMASMHNSYVLIITRSNKYSNISQYMVVAMVLILLILEGVCIMQPRLCMWLANPQASPPLTPAPLFPPYIHTKLLTTQYTW